MPSRTFIFVEGEQTATLFLPHMACDVVLVVVVVVLGAGGVSRRRALLSERCMSSAW